MTQSSENKVRHCDVELNERRRWRTHVLRSQQVAGHVSMYRVFNTHKIYLGVIPTDVYDAPCVCVPHRTAEQKMSLWKEYLSCCGHTCRLLYGGAEHSATHSVSSNLNSPKVCKGTSHTQRHTPKMTRRCQPSDSLYYQRKRFC